MIKKVRIDYSKRTSPGTLTTICSAKGNTLYDRNAANHRLEDKKKKPCQRANADRVRGK